MKQLKYLTKKDYETIPLFIKRIKHEMGHLEYTYFSCSDTMGKGIQILHLVSQTNLDDELKLEVYEDDMPELKKQFQIATLNEKAVKRPSQTMFSNLPTELRDLW